jgi:hypothetical protein
MELVGVLDPVRVVEAERDRHQPLAESSGHWQPPFHQLEHVVECDATTWSGRRVVRVQRSDMVRRLPRLHVEHRRIETT